MAVCYVEVFFLQNAVVDAGLLYLAALWRGVRARPGRIALGAGLGALWAVAACLCGGALCTLPAQAVAALGMLWAGAGRMSCRETAAALGAVWLGALVAGGAAALGLGTMLAGAASGVAGMALLRRRNAPPPPRVRLRVVFGGTEHAMEAVVDTGNRALDPVTGLPVIFLPGPASAAPAGRPLALHTASGVCVLHCFLPEAVYVNGVPVRAAVAMVPPARLPYALTPWALCAGTGKEAIA